MEIIKGDLIKLALNGKFQVIAHGCNCFCTQGAGIAKKMKENFETANSTTGEYDLENPRTKGDINKLGQIEWNTNTYTGGTDEFDFFEFDLAAVNCYTQYRYGRDGRYIDYNALSICMRKINHTFKGKTIGLPLIGGGLAGGDRNSIIAIMKRYLTDVSATLVEL